MTNAETLIRDLRHDLHAVEQAIRHHAYLADADAGGLRQEDLARCAGEQYHIIRSDLRSVALLVHRFGVTPSGPFFRAVLDGETAALEALMAFARAVLLDEARLQAYEPTPGAQAYPAFMAWLALYGTDAEIAAGFLVNFEAWGANCGRLSRALRTRYGLTAADTRFFDLFAASPAEFGSSALAVVDAGLTRGVDPRVIKRAARLLQGYEKLYWDTLLALSRP